MVDQHYQEGRICENFLLHRGLQHARPTCSITPSGKAIQVYGNWAKYIHRQRSYLQHESILLLHCTAYVRRFGVIRSQIFVYVPDSAVSEPATALGGKRAAPNRFLKPYVRIGAVTIYERSLSWHQPLAACRRTYDPLRRCDTSVQIMVFVTAAKWFRRLDGGVYSEG